MPNQIELALGDPNPLMFAGAFRPVRARCRFSIVATPRRLKASSRLSSAPPSLLRHRLVDPHPRCREAHGHPAQQFECAKDRGLRPRHPIPPWPAAPWRPAPPASATRETGSEQLLDVVASVAQGRIVFPFLDVPRAETRSRGGTHRAREDAPRALAAWPHQHGACQRAWHLSINTVKFHLRNLYEKLGFRNRAQAIAFYYSEGSLQVSAKAD